MVEEYERKWQQHTEKGCEFNCSKKIVYNSIKEEYKFAEESEIVDKGISEMFK